MPDLIHLTTFVIEYGVGAEVLFDGPYPTYLDAETEARRRIREGFAANAYIYLEDKAGASQLARVSMTPAGRIAADLTPFGCRFA